MERGYKLLVVLCVAIVGQTLTPSTYITKEDKERFKAILLTPFGDDVEQLAMSYAGLFSLGETLPEPQKACELLKQSIKPDNLETLFYASFVAKLLKGAGSTCDVKLGSAEAAVSSAIKPESDVRSIMFASMALQFFGHKVDSAKVYAALDAAIKVDDSPVGIAYAMKTASFLEGDVKKYHDMIEDVIAQSDEINDKYAQFEGGFITTCQVIDSAYRLSATAKIAPTIAEEKLVKFINYLLSRKYTESRKEIAFLLGTIVTLSGNKFHTPVAVTLASSVSISEKNPLVAVRVTDLLGKSVGKLTVTADTARHLGDDAVVLSKKPFAVKDADQSVFELDLLKTKPERGFYRITISIVSQQPDLKLLGTSGAEVEVKLVTPASVENMEISVADKEQSGAPKSTKVQYPGKINLEADYHQRLTARFAIVDKSSGKPIKAHQTFVRLTNVKTKQEVIFVAEEDTGAAYKFDLDVGAKAKEFNSLSGKYLMDLIVGDAVIENPISWTLADIQLTFHDDPTPSSVDQYQYSKRPEIKHLFREPEKRPPAVVSNFFTVLLVIPVLILLALWLKIGVNISNFPFSLSAIGFHVGLAAIFGLYTCYFLKLNMFVTLRYLGIIGIPTFLFGNKLLSMIAARRKQH